MSRVWCGAAGSAAWGQEGRQCERRPRAIAKHAAVPAASGALSGGHRRGRRGPLGGALSIQVRSVDVRCTARARKYARHDCFIPVEITSELTRAGSSLTVPRRVHLPLCAGCCQADACGLDLVIGISWENSERACLCTHPL